MRRHVCLGLLALVLAATAHGASWAGPSVFATGAGLVVDGRPYFPVLTWAACPQDIDRDLAAGINVFMHHGDGCGGEQAFLAELGQRGYYVPALDSPLDLSTDPRLFGYTQPDEPDGHGIAPEQLGVAPGRVVFMTLTPRFRIGLPRYGNAAGQSLYRAYRSKADVLGVTLYPLSHLCGLTALGAVYDVQRDLVALAGGRPTFQWIETNSLEGACGGPVTPATARAEAWLAVAGGARGLGWFTYGWPGGGAQSFSVEDDVAASMARTNAEIQALAPVLLAQSLRISSSAADPVKLGGRSYGGRTYVIAVNSYDLAVRWRRPGLPGLRGQRVEVVGEGRTLTARAGVLADSFAPLGVHVYAYTPLR